VFDVHYKKGHTFEHAGCDVHDGVDGAVIVSIYNEKLTAGSFTAEIRRKTRHDDKVTFNDPKDREFAWKEAGTIDQLLLYPSKEVVAEGNVDVHSGRGELKVVKYASAPDTAILVAAYVELLRKQLSKAEGDAAFVKAFKAGLN